MDAISSSPHLRSHEGLAKLPMGDNSEPRAAETFLSLRLDELTRMAPGSHSSKRRLLNSDEEQPSSRKRLRACAATTKTVRFLEDSDLVQEVTFHATAQELKDAWYCKRDYCDFQEDTQSTVLAFELKILDHIPEGDVCLRGLEAHLSNTMLEARISGKETMISFILRTQELQRVHQMYDDEFIRGLSLTLSKNSCDNALKLAAYDAVEARGVFAENQYS